jgi:hypothetical protein
MIKKEIYTYIFINFIKFYIALYICLYTIILIHFIVTLKLKK